MLSFQITGLVTAALGVLIVLLNRRLRVLIDKLGRPFNVDRVAPGWLYEPTRTGHTPILVMVGMGWFVGGLCVAIFGRP